MPGTVRPVPPSPRHPFERYQALYRKGGKQRSAGIYRTHEAARRAIARALGEERPLTMRVRTTPFTGFEEPPVTPVDFTTVELRTGKELAEWLLARREDGKLANMGTPGLHLDDHEYAAWARLVREAREHLPAPFKIKLVSIRSQRPGQRIAAVHLENVPGPLEPTYLADTDEEMELIDLLRDPMDLERAVELAGRLLAHRQRKG